MKEKKRLVLPFLFISFLLQAQEHLYEYSFFMNSRMSRNYFFSETKTTGASSIRNENNRLPVIETIFHTPGNSLQLEYKNDKSGHWQTTIYRLLSASSFFNPSFISGLLMNNFHSNPVL